jgi:outer membrane immunogenic protein
MKPNDLGVNLMKWKFIIVGALIAAATPTLAADLAPAPVEPVAPVVLPFYWGGFYIGADIGYSWASTDADFDSNFLGQTFTTSPDADGVVGGVYVGYNAQFNQIVVGIEADIEVTGNSGDDRLSDVLDLRVSADQNYQGSIRARLGWAIDNFMPYITGGIAFSDWDLDSTISDPSGILSREVFSESKSLTGWTLGAGLEYGFTQNLIGRIEYRYTDWGSTDFHNDFANIDLNRDSSINESTVRVGVAYKF